MDTPRVLFGDWRGSRGTEGLGIVTDWKERLELGNNIEQKNKMARKGSNT